MKFIYFLTEQNSEYLGEKISSVLNALQDLENDSKNLGNKQLISILEQIVNEIRKILHDDWDDTDTKHLKSLQKVGVALSNGIQSNDNLSDTISASVSELESVLSNVDTPINDLGSPQ